MLFFISHIILKTEPEPHTLHIKYIFFVFGEDKFKRLSCVCS